MVYPFLDLDSLSRGQLAVLAMSWAREAIGDEAVDMLFDYSMANHTQAQLAERYDRKPSSVSRSINRARTKVRRVHLRCGLPMPQAWERTEAHCEP